MYAVFSANVVSNVCLMEAKWSFKKRLFWLERSLNVLPDFHYPSPYQSLINGKW